jgi:hypothetical protein
LLATVFGFGAATAWAWFLGSRWHDVQLAAAHTGWDLCRQLLAQGSLGSDRLDSLRIYVDALADGVGLMSQLFPALLILSALPGLALAWAWYHRLAAHPAGRPGGAFAEFRFTDHMIWLVVLSVAAYLLPLPVEVSGPIGNLALIASGLYAARGLAVTWGSIASLPIPVLVVLMIVLLFILPVALAGWFAIGLADTWVDFRRRFRSADSRGE